MKKEKEKRKARNFWLGGGVGGCCRLYVVGWLNQSPKKFLKTVSDFFCFFVGWV
jgi:fluoride ion exporter CrcB/FEX